MKKKILLISGVLAIVIGLGVGMYQSDASQADPTLDFNEVKSLVKSQYPGTITELELDRENNREVYEMEIVNDMHVYQLKVDANSGEILKLEERRIATNEPEQQKELPTETITVNNEPNAEKKDKASKSDKPTTLKSKEAKQEKQPKAEKQENKNTVLDPTRAIEIALAEFPGVVDSVDLDEEDGRLIYEIEIESGELEAEFEIDAMTGEIIVIEIDD